MMVASFFVYTAEISTKLDFTWFSDYREEYKNVKITR